MGKKAREHRKKVQARNARIRARQIQLGKELKAEMVRQTEEEMRAAIAKNYEAVQGKLKDEDRNWFLEQGGVKFSS